MTQPQQQQQLSAFLDKSARYTKKWTKRFIVFEGENRKLHYSESSEKPPKGTLIAQKITRAAEKSGVLRAGNPDLYSFTVEGVLEDGKKETWDLRCPDQPSFGAWTQAIRVALAAGGFMETVNFGLDDRDPRCDLAFVFPAAEYLFRFAILERAIMYAFSTVTMAVDPASGLVAAGATPSTTGTVELADHIFMLGDKYIYVFKPDAECVRCINLTSVTKVVVGGERCVGICSSEQHDLAVVFPQGTDFASQMHTLVSRAKEITTREGKVALEKVGPSLEAVVSVIQLKEKEGYELVRASPTPKAKLRHALDVYEKQTGAKFVYGSAKAPAKVLPKGHEHSPEAIDVTDPMAALLMKRGLSKYVVMLQRQRVDIDLLSCMGPDDLVSFGIADAAHRAAIIEAVQMQISGGSAAPHLHQQGGGGGQKTTAPAAAAAAAAPSPRPIILDDDDDLPLPPPRRIVLDDDDDDLPLPKPMAASPAAPPPAASPAKTGQVYLNDSDDDLPLPPPKPPAAAKPPVVADDI